MAERIAYDEFSMFAENAQEFGIPFRAPTVRREGVDMGDGRRLSALIWGDQPPEYVFLHGGAQNAHTWDTVLLALDRPALALDLPGHGHSDGGRNGYLDTDDNADDVARAIRALAPRARAVIGMSMGGITALALAARHPALVRALVLVDVTPGVSREKAAAIEAFVNGPESFPDFDAILARTVEFNPTRTVSSLRRGILHNAEQRQDGTWVWRYARHRLGPGPAAGTGTGSETAPRPERAPGAGQGTEQRAGQGAGQPDPLARYQQLWDAVSNLAVPLMLVRGLRPQSVVDDADEEELRRRQPGARVERLAEAGHSVQGDMPLELAALIADFAP